MKKSQSAETKKLDEILVCLKYLVALELYGRGVKMTDIAKHIHVSATTVVKMLHGVKKKK